MLHYLKRPALRAANILEKMVLDGPRRIVPKGRTFSVQYSLPKLPVPPLEQTLRKYLEVCRPHLTDEEFASTKQVVQSFQEKEGVKLQQLLEDRAEKRVNWLSDWWKSVGYLDSRVPVIVNVSPGICFPRQSFRGQKEQLEYAAKLICGVLGFKTMLEEQSIPVDTLGGKPLCMSQYYELLNACRIPGLKKDTHLCIPVEDRSLAKHIIVIHNYQFFSVDVYGSKGKLLSIEQMRQQLEQCVSQSQEKGPQVGILTTMDRDTWGHVYSKLVKDKKNKASLESIQRSICVLCLDGPWHGGEEEVGIDVATSHLMHGGGSNAYSGNRWFDKTVQFIVNPDGYSGLTYEHTSAEGPALISLCDHSVSFVERDPDCGLGDIAVQSPTRLSFNFGEKTNAVIETAKQEVDSVVEDLMIRTLYFKDYGKKFIKQMKVSPDAFMQVAFQLAYYRMYKRPCATYETGSLRQFQLGRTETIQSCSVASHTFTQAMDDPDVPDVKKGELLRNAIDAHRKYINEVVAGKGIDRHLLGLKLAALESGMDIPQIFMDLSYKEISHFRLSTSQVVSKYPSFLCFGPVMPDGYGICYNPQEDQMIFSISSFNNSPETNSDDLSKSLSQSFRDMQRLMASQTKSKL